MIRSLLYELPNTLFHRFVNTLGLKETKHNDTGIFKIIQGQKIIGRYALLPNPPEAIEPASLVLLDTRQENGKVELLIVIGSLDRKSIGVINEIEISALKEKVSTGIGITIAQESLKPGVKSEYGAWGNEVILSLKSHPHYLGMTDFQEEMSIYRNLYYFDLQKQALELYWSKNNEWVDKCWMSYDTSDAVHLEIRGNPIKKEEAMA